MYPRACMPNLRLLILDNDSYDVELVQYELQAAGYTLECQWADTEEDFLARLQPAPDVIIAKYALPQLTALEALGLLRQRRLDVPFVIISNTVNVGMAVEAMKHGAADFIVKNRLSKLGETIQHLLEERQQQPHVAQPGLAGTALDAFPSPIAVLNAQGQIAHANAQWAAPRFTEHRLVGQAVGANYLDDCAALLEQGHDWAYDLVEGLRQVLYEGTPSFRHAYACPGGDPLCWYELRAWPLGDGREGVLVQHEDISARKKNEAALVQAREEAVLMSQLKSAFLANISHEIRTPLSSIIGFASILSGEVDVRHQRFMQYIEESGQRLLSTLSAILNLSLLEAGEMKLRPERVDVGATVHYQVDALYPRADEKGLYLEVEVLDGPVEAFIDPHGVQAIANNLVANAIKFTETGAVTVTVWAANDTVSIRVRDTGIGINESFVPQLFDEFQQESEGLGRGYEGIGIGLTITKRLVEMLGGEIEVDSEKGAGSTFTVRLPQETADLVQTPALEPAAPPPIPVAGPSAGIRRVLAVEDNHIMQSLLRRFLESADYEVTTAANGEDALELARTEAFDLLLLDINLGDGMTGVDVLREVRTWPGYAAVPTVAVTAYALPDDEERFLAEGFDGYLSKPFTKQALFAAIDAASCAPTA